MPSSRAGVTLWTSLGSGTSCRSSWWGFFNRHDCLGVRSLLRSPLLRVTVPPPLHCPVTDITGLSSHAVHLRGGKRRSWCLRWIPQVGGAHKSCYSLLCAEHAASALRDGCDGGTGKHPTLFVCVHVLCVQCCVCCGVSCGAPHSATLRKPMTKVCYFLREPDVTFALDASSVGLHVAAGD